MPVITRITKQDAENKRLYNPGTIIPDELFNTVKDAWIGRNGKLYYAGYYNHEESANILGYNTIEACEIAGYIHISSCFNGKPQVINAYARYTSAQKDTLAYYCAIHSIKNPLE